MKILVLDGIGGVPLGREIHDACLGQSVDACYYDCAELKKIPFYGFRSAFAKAVNTNVGGRGDAFFYLPRLENAEIESIVRREAPTHVLIIGFAYKFVEPAFLEKLKKKYGFLLFLYDTDSCNLYSKRREFIFFIENELPVYDEIFSFSRVTTNFFKNTLGLNSTFFPFGAREIKLSRPELKKHDVLFVGSCDLRRVFLLEHVRDNVTVFGNRWTRNLPLMSDSLQRRVTDRAVWGGELHQLFADSKIILNITRTPFYGAETGINLRIFEALSAGVFLLTDYFDEIEEVFSPGVELETFKSSSEMKEKVEYYLSHHDAREGIARCGHLRFLRDFTWERRAQELLQRMDQRSRME